MINQIKKEDYIGKQAKSIEAGEMFKNNFYEDYSFVESKIPDTDEGRVNIFDDGQNSKLFERIFQKTDHLLNN